MRMRQYVEGINCLQKAAEMGDSAPLCQNLINGIDALPPLSRQTPKIKPAIENAMLLASKYRITGPSGSLTLVGLRRDEEGGAEIEGNHAISSGTGFFINDEGLILTNRHVVKGAKTLLIMMNGKKQASGEIVVIDDEQDLALVKLKTIPEKTPFLHLAKSNNPGDGGGPMLDRFGNVMGVVTMKSANSKFEDSYGMAISSGKVRKFLEKNHVTVTGGEGAGAGLNAEEIAAKVKPAAVCILCTEREKE
jgi:S1-C subfamily serine protease